MNLLLKTPRLQIAEWEESMAEALSRLSQDAENRRFLPDEVFETPAQAKNAIAQLQACRKTGTGAQVCPILLTDGTLAGHVELCPLKGGEKDAWEAGYHIGTPYRGRGYAAEALLVFLPEILPQMGLKSCWGICERENIASCRVLERCGFQLHDARQAQMHGHSGVILRYIYTLPEGKIQKE